MAGDRCHAALDRGDCRGDHRARQRARRGKRLVRLILASQSAARGAMLASAGVPHDAMAAGVDEEGAKLALRADGLNARSLADALAELKAVKLSRRHPTDLVLGCDQIASTDDGI